MMMKGHCFYFCYLLVLLFVTTNDLGADASRLSQHQKPILKTIKSEDGDVVDCVHIYHQPAFDHPLMRDHIIKMKPSNHPQGFLCNNTSDKNQITQVWQMSGECPEGTVPIKKTAGQKNTMVKKKPRSITPKSPYLAGPDDFSGGGRPGHEYAIVYTSGQDKYYGAKAVISVWNPSVEGNLEFSLSQLWLIAGSGSNLNTIEVGWHVFPQINGDSLTRLFVYWTNDNYQTSGCYDLKCSGFVQTSNVILIGGSIANPGEITLLVWKDEGQKIWWLSYNDNTVGYWPFDLFTLLQDSASQVEYGGEIINSNTNGVHTATQMGSGEFAESGNGKASYFRNIETVNDANTVLPPTSIANHTSNSQCYDINVDKNDQWENFFYYGGPGRNPNCP